MIRLLPRLLPRFRSPLRGPWLTSVFAVVLLAGLPVVIVTGLLDHLAYGPGQTIPGDVGLLSLPGIEWPTRPAWLFRLTQGLHVFLGIVLVPVVPRPSTTSASGPIVRTCRSDRATGWTLATATRPDPYESMTPIMPDPVRVRGGRSGCGGTGWPGRTGA